MISATIFSDSKSPFWMAQWTLPDGKRQKRSTKVLVAGGVFRGEKLSRTQAKNRALVVAQVAMKEVERVDNMSVRVLFDKMLAGKLGRLSMSTYGNARTTYELFCAWLGKRADEPLRLVTLADIKQWVAEGGLWCDRRR